MSLRPTPCRDVPAATAAIARAAFPHGSPYLRLRDHLGTIFTDAQFASLFAPCGQPAECPWRLALVSLLQFAENLSDRRAADAVRSRIDWKYLLGLELTDPGFDASVLSEFRGRLVAGGLEEQLLDTLLVLCREHKLLSARGRQRTDSTHVLGAGRSLNRLISGRPNPVRASPCRTSSSIGIGKSRSVRPGTRAGAGFRITGRDGRPSRCASQRPTVAPAH